MMDGEAGEVASARRGADCSCRRAPPELTRHDAGRRRDSRLPESTIL